MFFIPRNRDFIDDDDDDKEDASVDDSQSDGGEGGSCDEIVAWEHVSSRTVVDNVDEEDAEPASESENDDDPDHDPRDPSSPLYRNDSSPSKRDRKRERARNSSHFSTELDEDSRKPLRMSRNSSYLQSSRRIVTSRSSSTQQVDKRSKRKRYLEVSDEDEFT